MINITTQIRSNMPLMQTFRTFMNPIEAEILAARLEDAGIVAVVNGGDVARTLSYIGPAVAKVKVEIAPEDFQRATEIVEADERQLAEKSPWICSQCNEQNEASFDLCWSCGKARSDDDQSGRYRETSSAPPIAPNNETFDEPVTHVAADSVPEETSNPYQPPLDADQTKSPTPQADTVQIEDVEDLSDEEKRHLRRIIAGSVIGLILLPPLVPLFVLYQLAFNTPYHAKVHPLYRGKIRLAYFLAIIGIVIGLSFPWMVGFWV